MTKESKERFKSKLYSKIKLHKLAKHAQPTLDLEARPRSESFEKYYEKEKRRFLK